LASVNLLDVKIRESELKLSLSCRVPFALGHGMAGQLVRVGSRDAGVDGDRRTPGLHPGGSTHTR
jgi:NADPH:quinone reductase-like Zn-dependent oxidoreductase